VTRNVAQNTTPSFFLATVDDLDKCSNCALEVKCMGSTNIRVANGTDNACLEVHIPPFSEHPMSMGTLL